MIKKWKFIWARKYTPYLASSYFKVFLTKPGFNFCKNKLFLPQGDLQAIYFAEDEFEKLISNSVSLILQTGLDKFAQKYENKFRSFLNWAKDFSRQNFEELSNKELVRLLELCTVKLTETGEDQFLAFVVLEGPGRVVEKAFVNDLEVLQWIAVPYKETRLNKIRMELLQMVADGKTSDKDLLEYRDKYAWINIYDIVDEPLNLEEVKKQVISIVDAKKEIEDYKNLQTTSLEFYRNFIEMIKDENLKNQTEIIHYFSYLKEMRDDYRREAYYLLRPFFIELGKRVGMSLLEVNYLLAEEIIELLQDQNDSYKEKVKKRQKNYSLVLTDGKIFIFDYDVSGKYLEIVNYYNLEIKGSVANKGKAQGRIKIIFHKENFDKFEKDDILVTPMTHPEFLPIMRHKVHKRVLFLENILKFPFCRSNG